MASARLKAVLLGPNGQLGSDIVRANAGRDALELVPVARDQLDVSDFAAVERVLGERDFDVLINCTSYHKTDEVESNADRAFLINAQLVRKLARLSAGKSARFVHVSTDYVFGGQPERRPLTEEHGRAPLNVYGSSKAMGEDLAFLENPETLVLRVSALFGVAGASGKGGNFVETMLRLAREKGALRVVSDQLTCPTSTADIADALLDLLEARAPAGVYHVVNSGAASWWALAKRTIEQVGLNVPVEPIPTSAMPTPAVRPPYSVLDNAKVNSVRAAPMPHWQDALSRYLQAKGHI